MGLDIATSWWFQTILFIMSGVTIYLLSRNNKKAGAWGVVIGLLSEPFWIYSSYFTGQWGVFAISFFYTFSYMSGIYNFWFRKKR